MDKFDKICNYINIMALFMNGVVFTQQCINNGFIHVSTLGWFNAFIAYAYIVRKEKF